MVFSFLLFYFKVLSIKTHNYLQIQKSMHTKVCSLARRCYQNPEINVLSLFTACVQKLRISPTIFQF